jgi:hypothetical protein
VVVDEQSSYHFEADLLILHDLFNDNLGSKLLIIFWPNNFV